MIGAWPGGFPPAIPAHIDATKAEVPPEKLDHTDRAKVRAAAFRAPKIYPGPVGEVLGEYLLDYESFGYRLGSGGTLVGRLVAHLTEET